MDSKKINIGIVGAGSMGAHHVRVCSLLKQVESVYVHDVDAKKGKELSLQYGSIFSQDLKAIEENCNAVIIAASTEKHFELGARFLRKGIPCLVEKPLSIDVKESSELVSLSRKYKTLLMVGHIEHFNPAFLELKKILKRNVEILSIDSKRLSFTNDRNNKIDVIFDLMIHDIELITSLVGGEIKLIGAGNLRNYHDSWGHVNALLSSQEGSLISISSSRVTQNKIRTLSVTTNIGYFHLDFVRQELVCYKGGSFIDGNRQIPSSILEMSRDQILVRNQEPLVAEVSHFVDCVLYKKEPIVTGEQGHSAVKIAGMIKNAIQCK